MMLKFILYIFVENKINQLIYTFGMLANHMLNNQQSKKLIQIERLDIFFSKKSFYYVKHNLLKYLT